MEKTSVSFKVFFDGVFWIGVFERFEDGRLSVFKVVFGAEPKDGEVLDFILKNYYSLKFSKGIEGEIKKSCRNPKRMQREIEKQMKNPYIGTKSQQALKLKQEEQKTERRIVKKNKQREEKQRKFEIKQKKRKEKHKGR